ncbi:helix-turn-helix domain-containing protein [Nonomuraea wenchangensis]
MDPGRRDRALHSLFASARALTALGEPDEVLAAIVKHAHDLVGTDFTYLSVIDEKGNLSLRAHEGVFSSVFRTARVPVSTGVGAKVIESAAPYWTVDYLADETLDHDPGFDEVVRTEGMKALLGVPLLVSGAVVGVLYAADRQRRSFAGDEVGMLAAFADHAAVVLENARLYQEARRALDDLRQAYSTIEAQVETMRRAAAIHEDLTRLVLDGGHAGEVAEMLVAHLGGRVTVYDRTGQIQASRCAQGPAEASSPVSSAVFAETRRAGRRREHLDPDGRRHQIVAVLAGETLLGHVVLTRAEPITDAEEDTLERAAQIVGLLTLTREAMVEAENRVRGELLTEVLRGHTIDDGLRARASARGVDLDRLTGLIIADAGAERVAEMGRRLHAMAEDWQGLAGEHLGSAVMLLTAEDVPAAARAVHRRLKAETEAPVLVVSGRAADRPDWVATFTLTARCLSVAKVLGDADRAVSTQDYELYALAFDPARDKELRHFLSSTIGPLLDYDRRRSTDLLPTLAAYFDASGNVAQAARHLHVHVNTMLKRLDRISELLGPGWRDPEPGLRIHLAVRLHKLSQSSR